MTLLSVLVAPVAFGNVVTYAQTAKDEICKGVDLTGSSCTTTSGPTVDSVVKLVINVLSLIVGIAAVIMIIIGGFKYITSSGDASNITSAKNTILYAVIGLVVVALAQVIVVFVLNKVQGSATPPGTPPKCSSATPPPNPCTP